LRERLFAAPVHDAESTVLRLAADDDKTVVAATRPVRAQSGDDATVMQPPREPAAVAPTPSDATPAPRPPAPSKAGMFLVAGMAGLAIVAGAVWFFTGGDEDATPAQVAEKSAPADAPASAAVVAAEPVSPARSPFSPTAVLDEIVRHADPSIVVRAAADKQRLAIGRDRMSFRVQSSQPGYLYVFLSGTDQSNLALLFPNAIDQDNRIGRDAEVVLPRKGWQITAGGPAGTNHLVAMVSREPRDFAAAGLKMGETIPEFELAVLQRLWSAPGASPGAGDARCPAGGGCDARYGASAIRIEEFSAK
jgi:hypothetical protein